MALDDFNPITPNDDHTGLVWSGSAQAGRYLVELQTGIIPQLVHLVFFDTEDGNKPVYTELTAFEVGDSMDASKQNELATAIATGLAEINA